MSTQLYDSNGNPIFASGAVGGADQQVSDSVGNIINPAKEDGNLLSIKTDVDNLDVLLSTRATESTVLAIKTQTDSLTFSSNRLVVDASQIAVPVTDNGGSLTVDGTVTANQGGIWSVRAQDGIGNPLQSTLVRSNLRGLNVSYIDGPQLDSYGRFRANVPDVVYASYFSNTAHLLHINSALTGGATSVLNTTLGSLRLSTTTASGDSVIIQTKKFLRYVPGVSFQIAVSGTMGPMTTNVRKRWGYFGTNNGFYFEQTGTDVAVVLRSNTSGSIVETRISQASWNIDKFDGTGPSGLTLDSSKQNLYIMDFVWQGTGRIRMGIMNGGTIAYCHEFLNSNTNTAPWMRSPSQPIRVEMTNTGATSGTNNLDVVCLTAVKESIGSIYTPYTFGTTTARTSITVGATTLPIISIRPALTFNGITNRVNTKAISTTLSTSGQPIVVSVVLNPALTGASWGTVNSNSSTEFDISATATTGGTILYSTYVSVGFSQPIDLSLLGDAITLGLNIAGTTGDILTITAQSTAGNTNVFGSLVWQEYQ